MDGDRRPPAEVHRCRPCGEPRELGEPVAVARGAMPASSSRRSSESDIGALEREQPPLVLQPERAVRPPSPAAATTRWHGTTIPKRLWAQKLPAARGALGPSRERGELAVGDGLAARHAAEGRGQVALERRVRRSRSSSTSSKRLRSPSKYAASRRATSDAKPSPTRALSLDTLTTGMPAIPWGPLGLRSAGRGQRELVVEQPAVLEPHLAHAPAVGLVADDARTPLNLTIAAMSAPGIFRPPRRTTSRSTTTPPARPSARSSQAKLDRAAVASASRSRS